MSELCPRCKARPCVPGRVRCAFCIARSAEVSAKRRQERRAKGLCYRCGASSPDRPLCEACRFKVKCATVKCAERKELSGECHDCPRPRVRGVLCEDCYAKSVARNYTPKPKRLLQCSECGETRHNARTCPNARRAA